MILFFSFAARGNCNVGLEHFSAKVPSSAQVQAMSSKMLPTSSPSLLHDRESGMVHALAHGTPHAPNAVLLLVLLLQISDVKGKESKSDKKRKLHTKYIIFLIMPER